MTRQPTPPPPNGAPTTEDGAPRSTAPGYMKPGPLLDAHGAAELLSVPVSWIRQETRDERIPHIRLGRYRRYDRAELLAWAAGRARGPRAAGSET